MAKQVIKNDGSKVAFDAKKINRAITKAAQDAKFPPAGINKLINEISDSVLQYVDSKDKITSSEIKDKALSELDRLAPKVSFEWRRFMDAKR
jgi:transcriptional regulator NrdR family protein